MAKENTSTRLKTIMKERNLRQVDILEKAMPLCKKYNVKLNKSDLSQYVSGAVLPGQEKLAILGKALGVSEAWLMGYDVPMNRDEDIKKIQQLFTEVHKSDREKVETLISQYAEIDKSGQDAINKMIHFINELNSLGQNEAIKRVEELTFIDKYKKETPDYIQPVAAHLDGELTDEVKDFIDKF